MTQDHYYGRRVASTGAAAVLEAIERQDESSDADEAAEDDSAEDEPDETCG